MRQKIPLTITIDVKQYERLARVSERTRFNKSMITRDALERELQRYEQELDKVAIEGVQGVGGARVVAAKRS